MPIVYLVLEQIDTTHELAVKFGPYNSGIAAFIGAGVAMVVGSLLKPVFRPASHSG